MGGSPEAEAGLGLIGERAVAATTEGLAATAQADGGGTGVDHRIADAAADVGHQTRVDRQVGVEAGEDAVAADHGIGHGRRQREGAHGPLRLGDRGLAMHIAQLRPPASEVVAQAQIGGKARIGQHRALDRQQRSQLVVVIANRLGPAGAGAQADVQPLRIGRTGERRQRLGASPCSLDTDQQPGQQAGEHQWRSGGAEPNWPSRQRGEGSGQSQADSCGKGHQGARRTDDGKPMREAFNPIRPGCQ